nr:hypothetical protein [Metabacillus crassostreae]
MNHLFVGSQLDGVKFGVGPGSILIKFMHYTSNQDPDELWINIESKWTVFSTDIKDFPVTENQIEDLTEDEEYNLIFKLRRDKVVEVKLGETIPHLIMTFQSGLTLFVNGHHDFYECWQAGDGAGFGGDHWLIVATPGNDIAIWAPDSFQ